MFLSDHFCLLTRVCNRHFRPIKNSRNGPRGTRSSHRAGAMLVTTRSHRSNPRGRASQPKDRPSRREIAAKSWTDFTPSAAARGDLAACRRCLRTAKVRSDRRASASAGLPYTLTSSPDGPWPAVRTVLSVRTIGFCTTSRGGGIPTPNRLVGHRHSALRQQILDVTQAKR